jgi:hypothetical protein
MKQVIITLMLLTATEYSLALLKHDYGNGILYRMNATDDVFVYNGGNQDFYDFLIVGNHPHYPLKRTLVKFEDIPHTCKSIQWAKMYLYFWYSHKASFMSDAVVPYIPRPLQVNQIKKYWNENTATRDSSQPGVKWSTPYLGLDGSDAIADALDVVTVYTGRPAGHMEFDITQAAKNWLLGQPNYGVVISATNEEVLGREARFYSRERGNDWRVHPIMSVLCHYKYDSGTPTIQTPDQLESTSSDLTPDPLESISSDRIIVEFNSNNAHQNQIPVPRESASSGQVLVVSRFLMLSILSLWMLLIAKTN